MSMNNQPLTNAQQAVLAALHRQNLKVSRATDLSADPPLVHSSTADRLVVLDLARIENVKRSTKHGGRFERWLVLNNNGYIVQSQLERKVEVTMPKTTIDVPSNRTQYDRLSTKAWTELMAQLDVVRGKGEGKNCYIDRGYEACLAHHRGRMGTAKVPSKPAPMPFTPTNDPTVPGLASAVKAKKQGEVTPDVGQRVVIQRGLDKDTVLPTLPKIEGHVKPMRFNEGMRVTWMSKTTGKPILGTVVRYKAEGKVMVKRDDSTGIEVDAEGLVWVKEERLSQVSPTKQEPKPMAKQEPRVTVTDKKEKAKDETPWLTVLDASRVYNQAKLKQRIALVKDAKHWVMTVGLTIEQYLIGLDACTDADQYLANPGLVQSGHKPKSEPRYDELPCWIKATEQERKDCTMLLVDDNDKERYDSLQHSTPYALLTEAAGGYCNEDGEYKEDCPTYLRAYTHGPATDPVVDALHAAEQTEAYGKATGQEQALLMWHLQREETDVRAVIELLSSGDYRVRQILLEDNVTIPEPKVMRSKVEVVTTSNCKHCGITCNVGYMVDGGCTRKSCVAKRK